ncbi:MAG: hypothetical protein E7062_09075 [Spirochaetaceae bacterium]|nr:hypothetical protein [Spirochaetaceae bacterium]
MKKLLLIALTLLSFSLFAQETTENSSSFTYLSAPIHKIYEHKDGYMVLYTKNNNDIGELLLPKKWFLQNTDSEYKAFLRGISKNLQPYVAVGYKDGSPSVVFVNAPIQKNDPVWKMLPSTTKISDKFNSISAIDFSL